MALKPLCPAPVRPYLIRLYTYSDAGSGGVINETYTFREAVWADYTTGTASERTQGEGETHEARARFTVHERVTVNSTDAVKIGDDFYRVIGVPSLVDNPQGALTRAFEGVWVDQQQLNTAES